MSQSPDFVSRLAILMAHYHLSASALADAIGVQRSGISHLVLGRNKPGLDFILKLHERFPEVNLYWLLKGEGDFLGKGDEPRTEVVPEAPLPDPVKTPASSPDADKTTNDIIVLYPDGTYQRYHPK